MKTEKTKKTKKVAGQLEWRTGCGVVEPLTEGDYALGDFEPCVHCNGDDCTAVVCLKREPAPPPPARMALRPGEPSWAKRIATLDWDLAWAERREKILLRAVTSIANGGRASAASAYASTKIAKEALALHFACDKDRVAVVKLQRRQDRQRRRKVMKR